QRQLRLIKADGSQDHLLLEADFGGRFGDEFSWSPDSRYLAVVSRGHSNQNIWAVNVESGQKLLLTNTAYDETRPFWSPDGKFLLFTSNRYGHSFPEFTGKWDLYRVWLKPPKAEFDEDKFEKMFEVKKKETKEKKGVKPAVEIKFKLENLDRQTEQITNTLGNDSEYVFIPEDETIYFVSNIDGRSHLWKTSLKKKDLGRFESFMPGILNPRYLQSDRDSKFLYYLSRGKIGRLNLKAKSTKQISFKTKIQVDKTADYEQMLAELYYTLQHYYYDPDFHHVNWRKIYKEFRPVLQQVREDQDFYDYANEMIGYLNSSHTGIHGPRKIEIEEPSAHVGAIWEFIDNKIILKRIIKDSPLYFYRDKIKAGHELIAIDDKPLKASQNIWRYLNGKLKKRLKLTFQAQKAEKKIDVFLKPISAREENSLLLEEWIQSRKELVKKKTNDQVAYIYMRAMGRRDLERFLKELEREAVPRKALILDLRFNFGGNVHDRVLQALTKPVYAKWRIRGLSETPQSTFGFTTKPVILMVNEVTLSDGEMTANGFKTLKRGPIVGNTTYGWLIFTTSVRLMNGGSFRLPFWGCYTLDGKDLETSGGVKPEVTVINDLNDELQNKDPQLERAIELALKKVNSKE
ncbi:MAG: S41 family peptidase, partial [Candidatus Aminicenantales bacterium]